MDHSSAVRLMVCVLGPVSHRSLFMPMEAVYVRSRLPGKVQYQQLNCCLVNTPNFYRVLWINQPRKLIGGASSRQRRGPRSGHDGALATITESKPGIWAFRIRETPKTGESRGPSCGNLQRLRVVLMVPQW